MVVIPAVVLFLAMLIISQQEQDYKTTVAQLESDFVQTEQARVRTKVNNMVDLVSYRQSVINQRLHNRIQQRVDDAHKIAMALYDFYKDQKSEGEIKQLIIESLRPLSWNNGESYIWIVDFDGHLQVGPDYLKEFEGQSIIDFEDATGRKVIQEEIAIANTQGKGFLWDTFTKPGQPKDKQFKQLAYIKKVGIFDWYLGSAEFLDTAIKSTHAELLEAINQVGKGDSDYIFVIDKDGNLLLNYARPDIVGRNMDETEDENLHGLFNKMISTSETSLEEFISYNWVNPITGLVDKKMTYLKEVPESNWVIGSGFYPKMLEQGYDAKLQRVTTRYMQKKEHFNTLMWLSVLGAFIFASVVSMVFNRVIRHYRQTLESSNSELKDLNLQLEKTLLEKNRELRKTEKKLLDRHDSKKDSLYAGKKIVLSRLEEEIQRAWAYKLPLAVVVFSVENYTQLDSNMGTDKAQALYSSLLISFKKYCKDQELVGPLANTQFLMIMPNLKLMQAQKQAESMLEDIYGIVTSQNKQLKLNFEVAEYESEETAQQLLHKLT